MYERELLCLGRDRPLVHHGRPFPAHLCEQTRSAFRSTGATNAICSGSSSTPRSISMGQCGRINGRKDHVATSSGEAELILDRLR